MGCRFLLQNANGGGEGCEGFYGTLKERSLTEVIYNMCKYTGMDNSSVIVDVGAGIGRYCITLTAHALPCPLMCLW